MARRSGSSGGARTSRALAAAIGASALVLASSPVRADGDAVSSEPTDGATARRLRRLSRPPSPYFRLLGSLAFGDALRFNNPYRLSTPLGDDAESVSVTAGYFDIGAAAAFGSPDGIQHGPALHLTFALAGVPQQVATPGYQVVYRGPHRAMGWGRFGTPVLLAPDVNPGLELAAGAAYFLTAAVAASAEVTFDLFYGAGTEQVRYAVYPLLGAQLGIVIDYEVLP